MLIKRAGEGWVFYCPACDEKHVIPNDSWGFNGNLEKPSFAHSVKITGWFTREHRGRLRNENEPDDVCHVSIIDGKLQYSNDCTHELANQKLPMQPLENYQKE